MSIISNFWKRARQCDFEGYGARRREYSSKFSAENYAYLKIALPSEPLFHRAESRKLANFNLLAEFLDSSFKQIGNGNGRILDEILFEQNPLFEK